MIFGKLNPIALALLASVAITGCNDSDSNGDTTSPSSVMLKVFDTYQDDVAALDDSYFGEVTDEMVAKRKEIDQDYLDKLNAIDRSQLTDEEKIYYDTFVFDREIAIRGADFLNTRFGNFEIPITHFYNYIAWNAEDAGKKLGTLEEYQEHISVVKEFTAWVNNLTSLYNAGIVDQAQLPKILTQKLIDSTTTNVVNSKILEVGLNHLKTLPAPSSGDFITEYETAVNEATVAVNDLVSLLDGGYKTAARGSAPDGADTDKNVGWGDLPNGKDWYQWQLDRNSTTGKSAAELHQMGEDLVADAKAEMIRVANVVADKQGDDITAKFRQADNSIIDRTFKIRSGGNINLTEFFAYLNSEKFFYDRDGVNVGDTQYKTLCEPASNSNACQSALIDYNTFKVDANDVVASYFKPIKTDYTIVPTPAADEPYVGVASYGGNKFNLNTNPDYSLQKWNVSTLLLHEAAPGHHFQNAYSIEYPPANKPDYIKGVWYTAYAEGWALYTEWLGLEMGIYGQLNNEGVPTFVNGTGMCKADTDYTTFQGGIYTDAEECNALQYFGSLNEAQLRNMRLAVDTGIHDKGWSIKEAQDYLHNNSALGDGDIESESYRYAAYVGQAVSYKSGYIVIKALLEEAQTELGDKFDWAAFHDQLLKYGDQPMEVVETSIRNWIKAQ